MQTESVTFPPKEAEYSKERCANILDGMWNVSPRARRLAESELEEDRKEFIRLWNIVTGSASATPIDTSAFLDQDWELVQGRDAIYERLMALQYGETALIRFHYAGYHSEGPIPDEKHERMYRYRKWQNLVNPENPPRDYEPKTKVVNRDKRDARMINSQSFFDESCFSNWGRGIEVNVNAMRNHDLNYRNEWAIDAEEMIVLRTPSHIEESNAWAYLQNGVNTHEHLEFYGCENYERVKKDLKRA